MPSQEQDHRMIWNDCRNFRSNIFDVFKKTENVHNWLLPGHFGATLGFVS